MIKRITGAQNPDFFFMQYSIKDYSVKNLLFIPKHFFVPSVIEKRNPLRDSAKRAGWVGCNILLNEIPAQGRILIVRDGHIEPKDSVIKKVQTAQRLIADSIAQCGWLFDVLNCVNKIPSNEFELADVYRFESSLASKHPEKNHIRPKIRQQLQALRDKGVIEFAGRGKYRKCLEDA